MSRRGRFLSLEGLEGVGKTSNLAAIGSVLEGVGIEALFTREPGGTVLGEGVRRLVLDGGEAIEANTELLLMAASRCELVHGVIEPALAAGRWVVSDRYLDASVAYQGGGRGLGVAHVEALHRLVGVTLEPDLTLLLDLPVQAGRERVQARGAPDRMERESAAFFERARAAYLERAAAAPGRVRVIDASRPLDAVMRTVRAETLALVERVGRADLRADTGRVDPAAHGDGSPARSR